MPFSRVLSKIRGLPARTAEWANRAGPIAMLSVDGPTTPGSGKLLAEQFFKNRRDSDFYAEITFHEDEAVDAPPETVAFLPVLRCGALEPSPPHNPSTEEWLRGCSTAVGHLAEKGFIPFVVGGDGFATQAAVESIKKVYSGDDIVLIHFSAEPHLSSASSPVRNLLENGTVKGALHVGNRCVSAQDRKLRRQFKTFYMDVNGMYSRGLYSIRDLRNDYPVYISINLDSLDPAVAPGVALPESGGFSVRELLHILQAIRGPRVVGLDIHGYEPAVDILRPDGVGLTQLAGAKIIKEAILKAYSITPATSEELSKKMQSMQLRGELSDVPEHYVEIESLVVVFVNSSEKGKAREKCLTALLCQRLTRKKFGSFKLLWNRPIPLRKLWNTNLVARKQRFGERVKSML